jgi:hypothetical protein
VEETSVVSVLPRYLIFMGDFEVPGRTGLTYETYGGIKNTLCSHEKVLGGRCYIPDYDSASANISPAGYGPFQKGMDCSKLESVTYLKEIVLQATPGEPI